MVTVHYTGETMVTNESAAVRAAILAGAVQQVQAEPHQQTSNVRAEAVRSTLAAVGGAEGSPRARAWGR